VRLRRRTDSASVRALGALVRPIAFARAAHVSLCAWAVHVVLLVGMAALAIGGWWASHIGRARLPVAAQGGFAALCYSGAIALYLGERLFSAVYARPFTAAARARFFFVRHPMVAVVLALFVHLSTALAVDSLRVVREASRPWALAGMALVVCCAVPFWFAAVHPVMLLREGRSARALHRTPTASEHGWFTAPRRAWATAIDPLAEVWGALRRRRRSVGP
jgi:hypothetical protein